jgi:hypothetical protein
MHSATAWRLAAVAPTHQPVGAAMRVLRLLQPIDIGHAWGGHTLERSLCGRFVKAGQLDRLSSAAHRPAQNRVDHVTAYEPFKRSMRNFRQSTIRRQSLLTCDDAVSARHQYLVGFGATPTRPNSGSSGNDGFVQALTREYSRSLSVTTVCPNVVREPLSASHKFASAPSASSQPLLLRRSARFRVAFSAAMNLSLPHHVRKRLLRIGQVSRRPSVMKSANATPVGV